MFLTTLVQFFSWLTKKQFANNKQKPSIVIFLKVVTLCPSLIALFNKTVLAILTGKSTNFGLLCELLAFIR